MQSSSKLDEQAPPIPVCFAMPTTDEELATAKENAISLNTVKSTDWASSNGLLTEKNYH